MDTTIISIHAARVGCDSNYIFILSRRKEFQSTQPEWAATWFARDFCKPIYISIHAARVGCDVAFCANWWATGISIHAARVGCDSNYIFILSRRKEFQSTQPEWAATATTFLFYHAERNFNPRSPSGLRLDARVAKMVDIVISIHAARVGCDGTQMEHETEDNISIHAARVGCDHIKPGINNNHVYFNPRSPSGLRQHYFITYNQFVIFQSTQPEWAATYGRTL